MNAHSAVSAVTNCSPLRAHIIGTYIPNGTYGTLRVLPQVRWGV